jgi:hypothetical protein
MFNYENCEIKFKMKIKYLFASVLNNDKYNDKTANQRNKQFGLNENESFNKKEAPIGLNLESKG